MSVETQTIRTDDGVDLHVQIEGPADAAPVLLSNSLGTNLSMWDGLAAHLAGRVRLVRYDKRGHGQSSPPAEAETSIPRLGKDALAVLDGLGLEKVRYCGLSIGGMTGVWLGVNAPDRFSCLALCNTAVFVGNPDVWNDRIKAVRAGGMESVTESVIQRWFTEGFHSRPNPEVEKVRQMLLTTSVEGYCACTAAVRDVDERDGLGTIELPTLVITGSEDPATPPVLGETIAAGIPGAKLVSIDGAAHLSNIEKPDAFNRAVGDFLLADGQS